jgi:hypothetical protein
MREHGKPFFFLPLFGFAEHGKPFFFLPLFGFAEPEAIPALPADYGQPA